MHAYIMTVATNWPTETNSGPIFTNGGSIRVPDTTSFHCPLQKTTGRVLSKIRPNQILFMKTTYDWGLPGIVMDKNIVRKVHVGQDNDNVKVVDVPHVHTWY